MRTEDVLLEFLSKGNVMQCLYWYLIYSFNFLMCVHTCIRLSTLLCITIYVYVCLDLCGHSCLGWYACMYSYVDMYLHRYIFVYCVYILVYMFRSNSHYVGSSCAHFDHRMHPNKAELPSRLVSNNLAASTPVPQNSNF